MQTLLADETMGGQGVPIARLSCVEDQHTATRTHQLQCRGHAGVAAADDDHVEAI
jgi:hypothetical protein